MGWLPYPVKMKTQEREDEDREELAKAEGPEDDIGSSVEVASDPITGDKKFLSDLTLAAIRDKLLSRLESNLSSANLKSMRDKEHSSKQSSCSGVPANSLVNIYLTN